MILTIRTFFKLKQLSLNTEHQLKSKLTWPVCRKCMKFKKNRAGTMTASKNAVLIEL